MKNNGLNERTLPEVHEELRCGVCGHNQIQTTPTEDPFLYGVGPSAVKLTVVVPVRTCLHCGCRFLDDEAQDVRHEAVSRHLGVQTPAELVALRERSGLSLADLARLIRTDEATLARWERGAWIQSPAQDQLLYLLGFPENRER